MGGIIIKKLFIFTTVLSVLLTLLSSCSLNTKTVVIYTSVDQVYSEKIFKAFEKKTGIKVKAVYDIEASKSVGLANRLIAEKEKPQADVFWNGEILQTLDLKEKGILEKADINEAKNLPITFVDQEGYWYGFGGRARVLIVNKALISLESCPKTLRELATSSYIKQTGLAYPIFGTTSTHCAALYTIWGDDKAKEYFTVLKNSGISILEGNSVVKDYVSQKKLYMGLTDTDDAISEMQTNKDLDMIFLDQGENDIGTLVTPNTVAMIKNAPHKEQAEIFMEYLLSAQTEQALVDDGWINIPAHTNVLTSKDFSNRKIKIMALNFNEAYKKLAKSNKEMTEIFVR